MMTARAWPLGERSGWRENRHDHLRGLAHALTRPSSACRYLPTTIKGLCRPPEWLTYADISEHTGRSGARERGDLGALTRLVKKTFGENRWPFEAP